MTEEQVEVLASIAGLRIDPAYLPSVLRNLEVVLAEAAALHETLLDRRIEPAPVFRA